VETRNFVKGRSKLPGDQVIFGANFRLAIKALEPAYREVPTSDVLEVLDECIVYGRTAEGADDGERLSGDLLRNHHPEARSNLGDELQEDRRSFLDDAAFGDEPGSFSDRLGKHASDGEVSALGCVRGSGPSSQCEDLDA
jgi:hypothetical protein